MHWRLKDKNVAKFNAFFVDVEEKIEVFELLKQFKNIYQIEPSFTLETQKGIHLHFLIEKDLENIKQEDWKRGEEFIVKFFNGDEKAMNPARILRIPDYKHLKDKNNPFDIKVLQSSNFQITKEKLFDFYDQINLPKPQFGKPKKPRKPNPQVKNAIEEINQIPFQNILQNLHYTLTSK